MYLYGVLAHPVPPGLLHLQHADELAPERLALAHELVLASTSSSSGSSGSSSGTTTTSASSAAPCNIQVWNTLVTPIHTRNKNERPSSCPIR